MKVFHLGSSKYGGDLSGKGAELFGGRWNRKGVPCIYTSATLSLAALEYAVNNSLYRIPRTLSYTIYEIPDKGHHKLSISSLPGNWADRPVPASTMNLGSEFLRENKNLILAVPSVIIPDEYNYLINTLHPHLKKIRILKIKDFIFDIRKKE